MNRIFSLVLLGVLAAQGNVRGGNGPVFLTNAAQVKALSVEAAISAIRHGIVHLE